MNRRESPSVFGSRPSLSLPTLRTGTEFRVLGLLGDFLPHCGPSFTPETCHTVGVIDGGASMYMPCCGISPMR